ncbi:MAG: UDP-glucose dehydrogenase family protein [Candidatus Sifarchaeia archaeon]
MRVLIIGSGYVGLCMGVVLAKAHNIILVDVDRSKVDMINRAETPIYEKDIDGMLQNAINKGTLKAKTPDDAFEPHDVVMIAVGTPSNDDGSVNLDYLKNALGWLFSRESELCNDEFCVICIKSTVLPGTTTSLVQKRIDENNLGSRMKAVFNPEFLREGNAIQDSLKPDRIVIGSDSQRATDVIRSMYESCIETNTVYAEMSRESAEVCKYASNCFLATKISFANEIANIVEKIPNADIEDIMHGVGLDTRISPHFFRSGAGYGGSCFPKDTLGLISLAEQILRVDVPILRAVDNVNRIRANRLVDMLLECNPDISGKKIAILGLAFKPDTDDTRDSPSYKVIDLLHSNDAEIWIHDPMMKRILEKGDMISNVHIAGSIDECLSEADGCILVTDWSDYKNTSLSTIVKPMRTKIFIDGRRVFAKEKPPEDVTYRTVGMFSKCNADNN